MSDSFNSSQPFFELSSEEVQEIISHPPHWLIRCGMALFFSLIMMLMSACWLIKYPETVPVEFTLTSANAPREVVVRSSGKLARLLVYDKQNVQKDQLLAYCESIANHEQIIQLSQNLKKFAVYAQNDQWVLINVLDKEVYTNLGEVQNDFEAFTQKLSELKAFLSGGVYIQKRRLLVEDLNDLRQLEKNLTQQLALNEADLELGREEFGVQEKLYDSKVIAPLEFSKEKAKLLYREIPLKNISFSLIQNKTLQTAKKKEILELDNAVAEQKISFKQALQTLQSRVEGWKQQFVLIAPVTGKVSFNAPWQEQQHLEIGDKFMTIEPQNIKFLGLIKVPQANIGKLHKGQIVLIKLDGFPYREFGIVEGKLLEFSTVPGVDSAYWGYVSLPQSLRTRYGNVLPYRNGLKGKAEIVTKDKTLAESLLFNFN